MMRYFDKSGEDLLGLVADRDTMMQIIKRQQNRLEEYEEERERLSRRLDEIEKAIVRLESEAAARDEENQATLELVLHELIRVRAHAMVLKDAVCELGAQVYWGGTGSRPCI